MPRAPTVLVSLVAASLLFLRPASAWLYLNGLFFFQLGYSNLSADQPIVHSAKFFLASAPFDWVNGTLVQVTVAPGCVPVVPPADVLSLPSVVALYVFDDAIPAGCASFADIINAPTFAQIGAAVSVFTLPASARAEEGYSDPIGNKYTYIAENYRLVVVNTTSAAVLSPLATGANVTVAVDGDAGNWVPFFASPSTIALRVIYGIFFWGATLYTGVSIFMSIRNDGRHYNILKYNNAIYWACFTGCILFGLELSIDFQGAAGIWTLGTWTILFNFSLVTTGLVVPLIVLAWAHVVSKVPINGIRTWTALAIQIVVGSLYALIYVFVVISSGRNSLLQASSPTIAAMDTLLTVAGIFLFVMCLLSLAVGSWLLINLRAFSGSNHNRSVLTKTTVLMMVSVFGLLAFVIIITTENLVYLTPSINFVYGVIEHLLCTSPHAFVVLLLLNSCRRYSGPPRHRRPV